MNRTTKSLIAGVAMTGLLAGTSARLQAAASATATSAAKVSSQAGALLPAAEGDTHSCKGQNTCKGKGGCKTGDNGCKGKNTCKGKGGCKTSAS